MKVKAIVLQLIQLLFLFATLLYVVVLCNRGIRGVVTQPELNIAGLLGSLVIACIWKQFLGIQSEGWEEENSGHKVYCATLQSGRDNVSEDTEVH